MNARRKNFTLRPVPSALQRLYRGCLGLHGHLVQVGCARLSGRESGGRLWHHAQMDDGCTPCLPTPIPTSTHGGSIVQFIVMAPPYRLWSYGPPYSYGLMAHPIVMELWPTLLLRSYDLGRTGSIAVISLSEACCRTVRHLVCLRQAGALESWIRQRVLWSAGTHHQHPRIVSMAASDCAGRVLEV